MIRLIKVYDEFYLCVCVSSHCNAVFNAASEITITNMTINVKCMAKIIRKINGSSRSPIQQICIAGKRGITFAVVDKFDHKQLLQTLLNHAMVPSYHEAYEPIIDRIISAILCLHHSALDSDCIRLIMHALLNAL